MSKARKARRRKMLGAGACHIVTYKREHRGGPLLPRSKWRRVKRCDPGYVPPPPRPRPRPAPAPAPHVKECSTTPRGTRSVLGTIAGAAAGLLVTGVGFFAVTTKDRALQQAAGAPSPKPGVATAALGVGAAVGGAIGGRYIATRKPTC